MFMEKLEKQLNVSVTENGNVGFKTTGKKLLDLNFAVSSLRNLDEYEIRKRFMEAFEEDKKMAIRWLFFLRDVRNGLGERRSFKMIIKELWYQNDINKDVLIELIPKFGRWDDLFILMDYRENKQVVELLQKQLFQDIEAMKEGKAVSLLAKWMPSVNTSSSATVKFAKRLARLLGYSEKEYRKTLSSLRKYMDVVEVKMSGGEWNEIEYKKVPSKANFKYNKSFLRNDEDRRRDFLEKVKNGEEKINALTIFPHEITHKYNDNVASGRDDSLEELWKALPNTVDGNDNTIVVADGSGSMETYIGRTRITALEVAQALAIYFAERAKGEYKDKYITFSSRPRLVDLSKGNSLLEKLRIASKYNEISNTNIEAVFQLILDVAVKNNIKQEDLPKNILILSDMEFDNGTKEINENVFKEIKKLYKQKGYKLPRVVYWNLLSRTETIPMKKNKLGVALVSGFSPNIMKMVLSNKTDPYECMVETLMNERYDETEKILLAQ